jgi:hypothetical protein
VRDAPHRPLARRRQVLLVLLTDPSDLPKVAKRSFPWPPAPEVVAAGAPLRSCWWSFDAPSAKGMLAATNAAVMAMY